ncbi:MAG: mechanosensitive ion channel [Alphaproteobacteria bacterium]|nr:mechanosensitive ion channel [Alphaproteobacteria bacterium]
MTNPYVLALLSALVAVVLHGVIVVVRHFLLKAFSGATKANHKTRTVVSLVASTAEFVIYFAALGFALLQFGISLTTYLASASILGLAFAFGSQGLVQDLVTGLTILVTDIFNVGEMLEVSGQVGIVEEFGMRFTVLRNANGALVYVPNRNLAAVTKYPRRHIRCCVDIVLPANEDLATQMTAIAEGAAKALTQQYPAIFLRPHSFSSMDVGEPARSIHRITFRIWPGRGAPIEGAFRQELLQRFKALDESFADWMVTVNYEIEVRNVNTDPFKKALDLLHFGGSSGR